MQTPPANFYEFGAFQLDPVKRLLRRLDGTPIPLTPRVFDTLLYMVEQHDSVIDKERIMEAVLARFDCRGEQPGAGDLEIAAGLRRNAGFAQLHRDGPRSRVSLCG